MAAAETDTLVRVLALWLRTHVPHSKQLLAKCLWDCSDSLNVDGAVPEKARRQTFSVEAIGSGKVVVGPLAFSAKPDVFTVKKTISDLLPACPVWSQRLFLGHGGQEIHNSDSFAELLLQRHERKNVLLVLGRRRLVAFHKFEEAGLRSELKDLSSVIPQPTGIQKSLIPALMMGENVVMHGGVGHTTSLAVAILQMIDMSSPMLCEAVVMCPTAAVCQVVQNTLVTCSLGLKLTAAQVPTIIGDGNEDQKTAAGAKIAIICADAASSDIHRALPNLRRCKFLALVRLREMWLSQCGAVELIFQQLVGKAQIAIFDDPQTFGVHTPGNIFPRLQNPVLLRGDMEPLILSRMRHYYVNTETDADKFRALTQILNNKLSSLDIFVLCSTSARAHQVYTWFLRQGSIENRTLHFLDPQCADHANIGIDIQKELQRVFVTSSSCLHPRGGLPNRPGVALNFDVPFTRGSYTVNSTWGYRNFYGTVVNLATPVDHELFEDLMKCHYMAVLDGKHLLQ